MVDKNAELTAQVKQYIFKNLSNGDTVASIAERFKIPIKRLEEQFKYNTGYTVKEYIQSLRLQRLSLMCSLNEYPQKTAFEYASELGFSTSSSFFNFIKKATGMTFYEFRMFCQYNRDIFKTQKEP